MIINKLKKNKITLLYSIIILIVVLSILSCKSHEFSINSINNINNNKIVAPSVGIFTETNHIINKIYENKDKIKYEIVGCKQMIELTLLIEEEKTIVDINGNKIFVDLNYYYDSSIEDALKSIKLFCSNEHPNELILLMPVITEEYLTYEIIKFDHLSTDFYKSNFIIETHKYDNIPEFYIKSNIIIMNSENNYLIKIDEFKYKGTFDKINSLKI